MDTSLSLAVHWVGGAAACAMILAVLLRTGLAWRLGTATPDHRTLHSRPTPRCGGLGTLPVIAFALATSREPVLGSLAISLIIVGGISLIDDMRALPFQIRLAVHIVAAALGFSAFGLPAAALGCLIVCGVVAINFTNFMDGSDGLVGLSSAAGLTVLGLSGLMNGHGTLALMTVLATTIGGLAAFLCFNWTPAAVFMGDVGSTTTGLALALFSTAGVLSQLWSPWLPFLVFSPLWADALVTLARRALSGERFWEPHRSHYYQRLIQMGLTHPTVARMWAFMTVLGGLLGMFMEHAPRYAVVTGLTLWFLVLAGVAFIIDRQWSKHRTTNQ